MACNTLCIHNAIVRRAWCLPCIAKSDSGTYTCRYIWGCCMFSCLAFWIPHTYLSIEAPWDQKTLLDIWNKIKLYPNGLIHALCCKLKSPTDFMLFTKRVYYLLIQFLVLSSPGRLIRLRMDQVDKMVDTIASRSHNTTHQHPASFRCSRCTVVNGWWIT